MCRKGRIPHLAKTKTNTKAETNTMTNTKTIPNADHLLSLCNTCKDWWWMLCAGKEGIPHPANSRRRHSPNVRPHWHLQLLCHHHDSTTKTQPLQNKEFSTHRGVQSFLLALYIQRDNLEALTLLVDKSEYPMMALISIDRQCLWRLLGEVMAKNEGEAMQGRIWPRV